MIFGQGIIFIVYSFFLLVFFFRVGYLMTYFFFLSSPAFCGVWFMFRFSDGERCLVAFGYQLGTVAFSVMLMSERKIAYVGWYCPN